MTEGFCGLSPRRACASRPPEPLEGGESLATTSERAWYTAPHRTLGGAAEVTSCIVFSQFNQPMGVGG